MPDDYYQQYAKKIAAVTKRDVLRVAKQYIDLRRISIVIVGDRKTVEPAIRALNHGPRTTYHGPRTSDHEPRTTNHVPRTTDHGPRTSDHGPRKALSAPDPQILHLLLPRPERDAHGLRFELLEELRVVPRPRFRIEDS